MDFLINKRILRVLKNILKMIKPKKEEVKPAVIEPTLKARNFSTDTPNFIDYDSLRESAFNKTFQVPLPKSTSTSAMDSKVIAGTGMDFGVKDQFASHEIISENQLTWYASQSFIGYQVCAMLAQHWLISKACLMPAKDAIRNGYEITVNDGTDVSIDVLDAIRKADTRFKLNKNLIEFVQMGRVFGIRIAMFKVAYDDPVKAYALPFNIDGIKPNSYLGISQIDPIWITPQVDGRDVDDPSSIGFYEPTFWQVNGMRIHKSHLIIFKTEEVADILKPTYLYGGPSIPQKIYERVYAAERTANEAPMLALTKRTDVLTLDSTKALANQGKFDLKMQLWAYNRDNYGVKTVGLDEKMEQFDTSLTDLDAVIMSQFQIVAAAANVPAVKLLGTSPKGFNATGEFEESSYHEELESIQTHDLQPLIERHHMLLIKSEIAPQFNIQPFPTTVIFNSLDAMTAKEEAELNKLKADTGAVLASVGAIDGMDERQRIINDPKSGYSGLVDEIPEEIENDPDVE